MLFSRKLIAAWAVLALSLGCTLLGWFYAVRLTEARARSELDAAANAISSEIRRRMTAYEQVLHAGAALFVASDKVSRAEWRDFVTHLRIDEHFPGIQGIGFARRIAPAELAAHIRAVRAEGFPEYTVRPEGARETYTSIVYLEPFGGRNLRAFGFDMFSEPVRREAMLRACDTANAALSGKVTLVQETERDVQAGFLLYVPVYAKVSPRNTAAERRAALAGWAYAPFRMNDFMRAFIDRGASIVDVDIFDGKAVDEAALLFDLDEARGFRQPPPTFWQRQDVLELAGQSWTLAFRPRPAFAAGLDATPRLILAGGTVISLLFFAIAAGLATTRERAYALAGRLNRELQQSHDELESKVAERTAEIERLLDASPMVIAYLVERRIVKVNRVVEALTGYAPKELLGQTTRCLYFSEEDYEAAGSALRAQLAETGRAQQDMRLRRKNGSGVWARFHVRLLDARDPARGAIYLAEDITELKRAEEQVHAQMEEILRQNQALAEANRAKTEFLHTMRHELRTPLNAVIGFAELLVEGIPQPLPETQHQYARDILDAGEGLLKLINEILLYTAGETGRLALLPRPIEIGLFLAERLRGFEGAAGNRNVALALDVAEDLPRLVADAAHLRTLIDHLLDNAVKFTPEGGKVTLRAQSLPSPLVGEGPGERGDGRGGRPPPPPPRGGGGGGGGGHGRSPSPQPSPIKGEGENRAGGSYLEISVTDTGIGIAAEDLPRLFKPFTQLDTVLTRHAAGTGMGLALARRLAELHGGDIAVRSEPDRGSTFTVRLPWQPEAP